MSLLDGTGVSNGFDSPPSGRLPGRRPYDPGQRPAHARDPEAPLGPAVQARRCCRWTTCARTGRCKFQVGFTLATASLVTSHFVRTAWLQGRVEAGAPDPAAGRLSRRTGGGACFCTPSWRSCPGSRATTVALRRHQGILNYLCAASFLIVLLPGWSTGCRVFSRQRGPRLDRERDRVGLLMRGAAAARRPHRRRLDEAAARPFRVDSGTLCSPCWWCSSGRRVVLTSSLILRSVRRVLPDTLAGSLTLSLGAGCCRPGRLFCSFSQACRCITFYRDDWSSLPPDLRAARGVARSPPRDQAARRTPRCR